MSEKSIIPRLLIQKPGDESGKRELSRRAASIHADIIRQSLLQLNCPALQKIQLLDTLMEKEESKKTDGLPP